MSITLPIVDLSAATVGTTDTVSWISVAGAIQSQATNASPATLWIFNESPCGLQLTFQTGERPFLPAGGWVTMQLQPNCTQYTYAVAYVMTGPLVTSLITVWFAPGEQVPNMPLLGNSPIGGAVAGSPATELQGSGQTFALTEADEGNGPGLFPTTSSGAFAQLYLGALSSNIEIAMMILEANNGLIAMLADVRIDGKITGLDGITAAGSGVPIEIATFGPTTINSTAQQTVIDYTPTANGFYRASFGVAVQNGTSGNNILAEVVYTAQAAAGAHRFAAVVNGGTAVLVLDGATSRADGDYACMPHCFYATTGGHIQIVYRDPTNTPADVVCAMLERLA